MIIVNHRQNTTVVIQQTVVVQ